MHLAKIATIFVPLALSVPAMAGADSQTLPLQGHTRPLSFTVAEGTWISVDQAPDGEQVVFDLLGDLYRMPAAGGNAVALTRGIPFDSQPRISPDGQWIAFISDRDGDDNLWIMRRSDGTIRQLSRHPQGIAIAPSWTADSQQVLVAEATAHQSAEAKFRLYALSGDVVDIQDKDGKPVVGSGGVLSRDGKYLYFAQRDPADESRYGMPIAQVRRLDRARGTLETLTNGRGGGTRPALSSDGKLLIYATREEGKTVLRRRDLASGADALLTQTAQQDRQEYGRVLRGDHLPGYTFTDHDQSLLLSADGKIRRIRVRDGVSRDVPFRADVSLEVGPRLHKPQRVEQGPLTARIAQSPGFSPDGRRIALSMLTRLYVMPARAGAVPKRVTRGDALEYQPVWSPDGEWLAYVVWSHDSGHIWKVRADGRDAQRLTTNAAFYTDLAFSPDGQRVLAMRGNARMLVNTVESALLRIPLDLIWIPSSGGEANVIAASYSSRYPHFSNDPERVYTTDGHGLYSVRYDGTGQRTHLRIAGRFDARSNSQPTAERIVVSPKADAALAIIDKQVWWVKSLPQGEPELAIDVHGTNPAAVRLTEGGADFFDWTQQGQAVMWAAGSTVHRRPIDKGGAVESIPVKLSVPRATPVGSLVLRGANVIPMSSPTADIVANVDIVIDGNRIVGVGPRGSIEIPRYALIVDVAGKFIVPGFIDVHSHWKFNSREIQDPDNWSLRANLAYGVTTGLDVQTNHAENFVYEDMVETGQTVGPRALMVGPGVFGINNYKTFETNFQSYEETLAYLRRYKQDYRTNNIKAYLPGNRRQRQWIVLASEQLGLMPTNEGFGDPFLAITHALDGMHGNEHALLDAPLYADVVETFARTQTSHTPTLNITHYGLAGVEYFLERVDIQNVPKLNRFYPRSRLVELTARRRVWARDDEFNFRVMAAQAAKIQRAGGLVGVGSHGEVQGLGYHWELQMMEMGGMQPAEILRAATRDGARIIGVEQDLGSLETGKLADLVVLEANPLQGIANANSIQYVMRNGVLYDGNTLTVALSYSQSTDPASAHYVDQTLLFEKKQWVTLPFTDAQIRADTKASARISE